MKCIDWAVRREMEICTLDSSAFVNVFVKDFVKDLTKNRDQLIFERLIQPTSIDGISLKPNNI